jgi:hypothetical protein
LTHAREKPPVMDEERRMSLKNNREVFSEVIVGLFMVAVLGLLVYFTIIISGIDVLNGKSKAPVTVRFHDVGGLKVRDSVILRGMTVGSVNDMRLENSGVRVTLMLENGVRFKEGYRISVNTGSLLGGNYLLIEEGAGNEVPRGTDLQGETPTNWMRDLGEIVANLRRRPKGGTEKHLTNWTRSRLDQDTVARTSRQRHVGNFSPRMTLITICEVSELRSVAVKVDSGEIHGAPDHVDGNVTRTSAPRSRI